jgi:hypothetical protein
MDDTNLTGHGILGSIDFSFKDFSVSLIPKLYCFLSALTFSLTSEKFSL